MRPVAGGCWAKIQPLHDELLELQVAKARMEVHGSNVYRELPERPKPKKAAKNITSEKMNQAMLQR